MLARGAALAAIRSDGLVLLEGEKRETFRLAAADRPNALPRPDAIVLAAKTYAFSDIVTGAAEAFAQAPMVVTATNGLPWWFLSGLAGPLEGKHLECVDAGGRAGAILARTRPLAAVVHASMRAEAPGVIRIMAVDKLIVGERDANVSRETVALSQLVNSGGVECVVASDIRLAIWAKLWGNMNMNPVSALTRRTANGILGDSRLQQLVREMMTEFVAIGERLGLKLPMTVDERLVVTRRLGDFRTSMLNDVEAGRPLEVDGLLGVVMELAEKLGMPAPATRTVYALARALPRAA
jgi:2-dehydropantoate 2-reductase